MHCLFINILQPTPHSVTNVWRIKSIFYFHNEIPKWPTKWPPNRKLATIFKTDKVKVISPSYGPFFIHMHQYKYKPYYLPHLAMTEVGYQDGGRLMF